MFDDIGIGGLLEARARAALYEQNLDRVQRKRLGQYFTSLSLARILAAISVTDGCQKVIDPMGGTGDLLDAVFERCEMRGIKLSRIDAIEVDSSTAAACQEHLQPWIDSELFGAVSVIVGNAFDSQLIRSLPESGYDLVITNPPYVRYQRVTENGKDENNVSSESIRNALYAVVSDRVPASERKIWHDLVQGYSGLSDLSVPAWLLAATLVREGGKLALVAPATWQNRDYADVLQYLLARCFKVDCVIADRQPGWFSEALVRTHLVVATRLPTQEAVIPLVCRDSTDKSGVLWVEVAADAKKGESLIGAAFDNDDPEGCLAEAIYHKDMKIWTHLTGIDLEVRYEDVIARLSTIRRSSRWLEKVEAVNNRGLTVSEAKVSPRRLIPHELKGILPERDDLNLLSLKEVGIQVSQGLRTGCNGFFYVDLVGKPDDKNASARVSRLFGGIEIVLPQDATKEVIRQQSEIDDFIHQRMIIGRALCLQNYALPEDLQSVREEVEPFVGAQIDQLKAMPEALADFVRKAATTLYGSRGNGVLIPNLSAVRTNIQEGRSGPNPRIPRFWYMLPAFTRRHFPDAFIPRVNKGIPWVITNRNPRILIDANFSTIWSDSGDWSPMSIAGALNSSWARAFMEAVGTPMGGGALKLEATHLSRVLLPELSGRELRQIALLGAEGSTSKHLSGEEISEIDFIILRAATSGRIDKNQMMKMIVELRRRAEQLRVLRQRK